MAIYPHNLRKIHPMVEDILVKTINAVVVMPIQRLNDVKSWSGRV
jgi:hypothetical protein